MNFDKIIVKTYAGLEEVLQQELKQKLGIDSKLKKRAVELSGDLEDVYLINLHIGTALKVLVPILTFKAFNDKQLYKKTLKFEWEDWLSIDDTFVIDAVVFSEVFRHSQFAALRVKDAICDRFRDKFQERPSIDKDNPTLRINLHIADKQVTLLLDSSGNSLHQRGYKRGFHPAPISEVLAHGIIRKIRLDSEMPLIDPMCGSGTFLTEAVLALSNTPPNIYRKEFGFMKWKNFDSFAWENILNQSKINSNKNELMIKGYDLSEKYVSASNANLKEIKFDNQIMVEQGDFFHVVPDYEHGVMLFNPPYNERLRIDDLKDYYKSIGDKLKQDWTGWDVWMITSNMEALKFIGLRPSKKIILFNGALECRLVKYEMYRGSKKEKKN